MDISTHAIQLGVVHFLYEAVVFTVLFLFCLVFSDALVDAADSVSSSRSFFSISFGLDTLCAEVITGTKKVTAPRSR